MYEKHFGLHRKPFELSPDSNILFLGETHKKALAVLKEGVVSDKGFLLFTGGVGTGKTTLINVIANVLEMPGYLCVISNPTLDVDDFFYYFAAKLGLLFDGNKAKFLVLFSKLLEECRKRQKKVLLIVDEAHALPTDLLEELRLLVNMAAEIKGALSIFLVGQPELLERLKEEQLSYLSGKIAVRFHLEQLSHNDSVQYVLFRLNRAGAKNRALFTEQALDLVYQATQGNPRQINILCDSVLLKAYGADRNTIDHKMVRECVEDLHIEGDDEAFYLPKEKAFWQKKWVIYTVLAVLIAEGALGYYAFRQGWFSLLAKYLKQLMA